MSVDKLVIHVGYHKTGTTSLQYYMDEDRERLFENNIYFPKIGLVVSNNKKGEACSGHDEVVRRCNDNKFIDLFKKELESLESKDGTAFNLFLSAENLIPFYSSHVIKKFLNSKLLEVVNPQEILILISTRDVQELFDSHYNEILSNGVSRFLPLPQYFYKKKAKTISQVFSYLSLNRYNFFFLPPGNIFVNVGEFLNREVCNVSLPANHRVSYSSNKGESIEEIISRKFGIQPESIDYQRVNIDSTAFTGKAGKCDLIVPTVKFGNLDLLQKIDFLIKSCFLLGIDTKNKALGFIRRW